MSGPQLPPRVASGVTSGGVLGASSGTLLSSHPSAYGSQNGTTAMAAGAPAGHPAVPAGRPRPVHPQRRALLHGALSKEAGVFVLTEAPLWVRADPSRSERRVSPPRHS